MTGPYSVACRRYVRRANCDADVADARDELRQAGLDEECAASELSRTQALPTVEAEQVEVEAKVEREQYSPPNHVGYSTTRRTAEMPTCTN
jgi:hypothetical protein